MIFIKVEAYLKYVSYLKSTAELGNERDRISSQPSKVIALK